MLQLQNAVNRLKNYFDNINIDWNLSHDDGSTDFSDDETIIEDRVSALLFNLPVVLIVFETAFRMVL